MTTEECMSHYVLLLQHIIEMAEVGGTFQARALHS